MQTYQVSFDDGPTVEVETKSRDIAKLERLGFDLQSMTGAIGSYAVAYVALQRMHRQGLIDFDLPESAEALEDIADLSLVEEADEGEGSDPAAVTG